MCALVGLHRSCPNYLLCRRWALIFTRQALGEGTWVPPVFLMVSAHRIDWNKKYQRPRWISMGTWVALGLALLTEADSIRHLGVGVCHHCHSDHLLPFTRLYKQVTDQVSSFSTTPSNKRSVISSTLNLPSSCLSIELCLSPSHVLVQVE
jgi:hypothetical protein